MKYTTKEFKGNNIFQIWKDDATPGAEKEFPIVSFGVKKAEAIALSIAQIQAFVTQELTKKAEELAKKAVE